MTNTVVASATTPMLGSIKLALGMAIIVSTIVSAEAAAKHPRLSGGQKPTYTGQQVPTYNGGPPVIDPKCPASGGATCSDACLPSGPPCRTHPDGW